MSNMDKDLFLRFLKGAPLSVLIGLWVHGSMNRAELKRKTGYGVKTLDDALAFLDDAKLVERLHYRKWSLASGFYQLPLISIAESGKIASSGQRLLVLRQNAESGKITSSGAESGNFPLSALVSSSSNILLTKGNRSTTTKPKTQPKTKPDPDSGILNACRENGIYGQKARLLATLPHVINGGADYVRGHVDEVRAIGKRPALAIWRMEQGWELPKSAKPDNCCPVCKEPFFDEREALCLYCAGIVKT